MVSPPGPYGTKARRGGVGRWGSAITRLGGEPPGELLIRGQVDHPDKIPVALVIVREAEVVDPVDRLDPQGINHVCDGAVERVTVGHER